MARGPVPWSVLLAAGAGALTAVVAGGPAMPPFLPTGDDAAYDVAASRSLALIEPIAHAPWWGALDLPMAMLVAALAMAALWLASRRAGASAAATAVVIAAFLSRPDVRVSLAVGAPPLVAVAFLWATVVVSSAPMPTWRTRIWAALLAAAAVVCWPPVLVVAPWLVVVASTRAARDGVLVLPAMAAGLAGGLVLWATYAGTIANETVSLADAWTTVVDASPRGHDPYVWPRLAAAELPVVLAIVGGIAWWGSSRPRRTLAVTSAVVATAAAVVALPAWRSEFVRAIYWSGWPLVAVGLGWLGARAPGAGRVWATGGLAAALLAGGVSASLRPGEATPPELFAAAFVRALGPSSPGAVSFVAEDPRVDAALVAWGGERAPVERVRAVPALVDTALERGRSVLAGPSGRSALELWGYQFEPKAVVGASARFPVAALAGRLRCVVVGRPWRELPGVEFTGRLGVHVPAGEGRLELVAVAPPPFALQLASVRGRPLGRIEAVPMSLTTLPGVLWPGDGRLPDESLEARRVELAGGDVAVDAALALGVRAPLVAVRYVGVAPAATVCAAPLPRDDPNREGGAAALALDDPAYFAGGWHPAEGDGAAYRWTARRAITLVPSRMSRAVRVSIDARPADDPGGGPVVLRALVNGWPAGDHAMDPATRRYEWQVPASIWVDGTNEVAFEVSRTTRSVDAGGTDARELGVQVTALRISPGG